MRQEKLRWIAGFAAATTLAGIIAWGCGSDDAEAELAAESAALEAGATDTGSTADSSGGKDSGGSGDSSADSSSDADAAKDSGSCSRPYSCSATCNFDCRVLGVT